MRLNRTATRHLSWREVLKMALRSPVGRRQALVAARRGDAVELDARRVHYAVHRVARELGRLPRSPSEYEYGRDMVISRDRRRTHGGMEEMRLPTPHQLTTWARTTSADDPREAWELVLEAAGSRESPAQSRHRSKGLPFAVGLAHFALVNGYWPSDTALTSFCIQAGAALARRTPGKSSARYIAEASALLECAGHPLPADASGQARGRNSPFEVPSEGLDPAIFSMGEEPSRPRTTWTRASLVEKLAEFDRLAPRSEGRSQRVYRRFLREHPGWPSVSAVTARGWTLMMTRAMRTNDASLAGPAQDEAKPGDSAA